MDQLLLTSSRENPKARGLLLPALLAFLVPLFAHAMYVSLYAGSLPFWDQWQEINGFMRPWLTGQWHLSLLFVPHNEHRIAFTRLFDLMWLLSNRGHWDNLVVAYGQCILYAVQFVILFALLCKHASLKFRLAFLACVICVTVLPYDWANTNFGFQNQFYFMTIGALAAIAIAAWRPASITTFWLLCLVGVLSLFTMASGVLATVAVITVMILCYWRDRSHRVFTGATITAMIVITVVGLAIIPSNPGLDALKAKGLHDWYNALSMVFMWPVPRFGSDHLTEALRIVPVVFIWLPSIIWLVRFVRSRKAEPAELFAAGIAVWATLQALSIAQARGHMGTMQSRYTDLLAMGTMANAWFALRLLRSRSASSAQRVATNAATGAFFVVILWGFVWRTPTDMAAMRWRHGLVVAETANVENYLRTHDTRHFMQLPGPMLSYFNAEQLRGMLDDPVIQAMLPVGPAASADPGNRPLSTVAAHIQDSVRHAVGARASFASFRLSRANSHVSAAMVDSNRTPAHTLAATETATRCDLDELNGKPIPDRDSGVILSAGQPFTIVGWYVDRHHDAATTLLLTLTPANGGAPISTAAQAGLERIDVADALKTKAATFSGFIATVGAATVSSGRYRVTVSPPDDSVQSACDLHVMVDLLAASRTSRR